jgi:UDP-N-acetylmuramoyl-tripeptide--D-alanyl-D-alanine ligase
MGALARECGVTRLLALGTGSLPAVEAFGVGATWHANADELIAALLADLREGITIYVKGSRVNRLERVAGALSAAAAGAVAGGH